MARYSWGCRLFFLGTGLFLGASNAFAENWERFRGPNGVGISHDKNIPVKFSAKENLLWKAPLGGDGNGSPIVWGDRLFLQTTSRDGSTRSLLCLDTKTGQEVWKRTIPGVKVSGLRKDSSLASATPTTDGEAAYIPFWNGKDVILMAYNFKGDKLWERNLGELISQHGAGVSPILYKDLLIYPNDKDAFRDTMNHVGPVANPYTLYALNKRTGETVWERPRAAVRTCYSVPFILNKLGGAPELIVTSTSAITSYDPDSGNPNWSWKWAFPAKELRTIASTTYMNGLLLASSGDGNGDRHMVAVALNGFGKDARPDKIWENKKDFPYVTCMLTRGEHVYFVNDSGMAGCYRAKTGKKVWSERLAGALFYASPIMIDGKIYACSWKGDVFVIAADPSEFQLLARNSLDDDILATPAVANGHLYIRGKSHLYCFGQK